MGGSPVELVSVFKRTPPKSDSDNPLARRMARGDDTPTVPLEEEATRQLAAAPTGDAEPETRILGSQPGEADPVVGILLVIKGPGRGRAVTLGQGVNELGRGEGQRARVDFGDDGISRERQAVVSYDPKERAFWLQPGSGPNLVYLGNDPVLAPMALANGDRITVSETRLLFRPLVGDDFDWSAHEP